MDEESTGEEKSMIEETKKILNEYIDYETWLSNKSPVGKDAAQQICHLFPKSPDNPDGYDEPKPDGGRLLKDEEIVSFVKAIPTESELALARIARREQDAKTASIYQQKFSRLVGNGFCISPKLVLTNDEAGWFASYIPNAPRDKGEIVVVGDSPFNALDKLWQVFKEGIEP